MSRSRASAKQAGTRFETQCAEYLTGQLGKKITRMPKSGAQDKGDLYGVMIHGAPMVVECKSPGRNSQWGLAGWWEETLEEAGHADTTYGFLAIKRFNSSIDKSFCVVDDTMWEDIGGGKHHTPAAVKSVPRNKWGETVDTHGVFSFKMHGKDQYWVVCDLETMAGIIDSEKKVLTVNLPVSKLEELENTRGISVVADNGEGITINLVD